MDTIKTMFGLAMLAVAGTVMFPNNGQSTTQPVSGLSSPNYVTATDLQAELAAMENRLVEKIAAAQCVCPPETAKKDVDELAKAVLDVTPKITLSTQAPAAQPLANPQCQVNAQGQCVPMNGVSTQVTETITAINGVPLANPIPVTPSQAGQIVMNSSQYATATQTVPTYSTHTGYYYSSGNYKGLSAASQYAVTNGARYVRETHRPRRSRTVAYF